MAVGQVFLQRHEVTNLDSPPITGQFSQALGCAHNLVPKDARTRFFVLVHRPASTTHAGGHHPQKAGVGRNFRDFEFAQFSLASVDCNCRH